jgi:hypothetical protein
MASSKWALKTAAVSGFNTAVHNGVLQLLDYFFWESHKSCITVDSFIIWFGLVGKFSRSRQSCRSGSRGGMRVQWAGVHLVHFEQVLGANAGNTFSTIPISAAIPVGPVYSDVVGNLALWLEVRSSNNVQWFWDGRIDGHWRTHPIR